MEKAYWEFSDGNIYSKNKYSLEEAEQLNATLKNCSNCIDCSYCTDCGSCENCHTCINCCSCISK